MKQLKYQTQENLAEALGVTSQAVSRWESCGSYPDMEIIPSIANFFRISIDELFGYDCERKIKIDALIAVVDKLNSENTHDDVNFDECLTILRNGIAEFPGKNINVKHWKPGKKTVNLPQDWPMWCNPDYTDVKAEITADPRWKLWVKKTAK